MEVETSCKKVAKCEQKYGDSGIIELSMVCCFYVEEKKSSEQKGWFFQCK